MSTKTARAATFGTSSGSTWSTTANAVDGAYGATNNTYATFTSLVASATGYIEVNFGTQLSSTIPANATGISVSVTIRHLETNVTTMPTIRYQPYDGATAIGSVASGTANTANHANSATFTPTVAQIRSATFKVRVTCTRNASTTAGNFSLDNVDILVTYTTTPVTAFTKDKTTVEEGGSVTFTDTSTGDAATNWNWNFGAGATPAGSAAKGPHTVRYDSPGTSTVTHSATNASGTVSAANQTVTVVANPKTSTIRDDFTSFPTGWIPRSAKTTGSGGQVLCASTVNVAGYTGADNVALHSLRESQICIECVDAGDQAMTSWGAYPIDLANGIDSHVAIFIGGGSIAADLGTLGLLGDTAYNPTTMRWVRIRETAGTTYFETSPDNGVYTAFYTHVTANWPVEMDIDRVKVAFSAGTWQGETTVSTMVVDNINKRIKVQYLKDPFLTQIDPIIWPNTYGSTVWDTGRVSLTERVANYSGLVSEPLLYDLTNSAIFIRMYPAAVMATSTESMLSVYEDGNNGIWYIIYWDGSAKKTIMRYRLAGSNSDAYGDYDPVAMAFLRIRMAGTTMYWDTSPDAVTWTLRRSFTVALALTAVTVEISIGQWQAEATQGTAYIDDVNVAPAVVGGRPKVWMGSAWANKPAKYWNGTSWVEKPMKVWTGSTWKLVT